eukprot:1207526-Amphidinium_carterae.1
MKRVALGTNPKVIKVQLWALLRDVSRASKVPKSILMSLQQHFCVVDRVQPLRVRLAAHVIRQSSNSQSHLAYWAKPIPAAFVNQTYWDKRNASTH